MRSVKYGDSPVNVCVASAENTSMHQLTPAVDGAVSVSVAAAA